MHVCVAVFLRKFSSLVSRLLLLEAGERRLGSEQRLFVSALLTYMHSCT